MLKRIAIVVGGLTVAGLLAALLSTSVLAQSGSSTPTPAAPEGTPTEPERGGGWDMRLGCFGGGDYTTFDAVAKALGLTPTELFDQLHSGKTIAEIATAKGVDVQTIQDAVNAARTEAVKAAIAQAVKDGKITQAQADWLLKGIEQGFVPGGRFGFGMHGGMGGFGPGMRGGMREFRGGFGQHSQQQEAPEAQGTPG